MTDKIKQFPSGQLRRQRLNLRKYRVACEVSGRWLQFPEKSSKVSNKDLLVVNVMTLGNDDKEKKLCELVISRQDIIEMLNTISTEIDD